MRHLLLIGFLISSLLSFSQLDTIQCSDYFPPYINDAKYLALRNIISANDPYEDSVIIPASHYLPILRDLYSIDHYRNHSMVDSIFNLFHIHAVNYPNTSDIFVDVSKRSLWAQNLYHDSLYAGNDTLDNLVNQYGLYYTSVSAFVNNDYIFDILSSYPINMRPIVNEISSMTDIITVFDDNIYLDNSDIILVDSGFVRHYTFRYGTGDCESGCTINYYWKFSVYGDCVVQFDTSYGFGNSTLGVKETTISSLNLYPNPTSKVVYIELSEELSNHGILRLITAAGSIIKEMNINSPKMNLDVSGLSPGVYEAVLFSDNSVVRKKLVIYQP